VMFTGQLTSFPIVAGAMIFGILTAFLAQALSAHGKVAEDAALGVVFTSMFAVGVILLSQFLGQVHIDVNCVFYGLFELIPLNTFELVDVPVAFPTMLFVLLLAIGFITLFWKELQLASFDPELATAMGFPAGLIHYLLVGLVAACTVTAFEAVGSVVVLAMFIVPAATAQMLTERLRSMLWCAAGVAVVSAVGGYLLATRLWSTNIGGMIAATAGVQLLLAVLFAPRHGVVAKLVRNARLAIRMAGEEILATLYRAQEKGEAVTQLLLRDHGFSPWTVRVAQSRLSRRGQIERDDGGVYHLTETGHHEAARLVRAHRLWEAYLGENFDLPLDHLHAPASRVEHYIGPALQTELAQQLKEPAVDPHGKVIPPEETTIK
jgi:manganese/zinc/iron transport system permease protein